MLSILTPLFWLSLFVPPVIVDKPFPSKLRRDTTTTYIVIHNDSSPSPTVTFQWLRKKNTSYHYYIDRTGKIYKMIDPSYQANHAGISFYDNLRQLNKVSIGICLQNKIPQQYTEYQYESLSWLVNSMYDRYPESRSHPILGHDMIAWPRGRKSDPGEHFDWNKLYRYLYIQTNGRS
jgi:N-acetyl-anhydromuramyl-L-alanine amidase AmpD